MTFRWSPGERSVQQRFGESKDADRLTRMMSGTIPTRAQDFLLDRRILFLGSRLDDGLVWPSLISGPPGFLTTPSDNTILIEAATSPDDPITGAIQSQKLGGSMGIDFSTRRRMRANGRFLHEANNIGLSTHQVLSNCPKYIQQRHPPDDANPSISPSVVNVSENLSSNQKQWIQDSDTMFFCTSDPEGNADVSHRGGLPGFVSLNSDSLTFTELPGNSMYLTLGNLETTSAAGLLFPDFDRGRTLHISGEASVDYSGDQPQVTLRAKRVMELANSLPHPWTEPEYSPFLTELS